MTSCNPTRSQDRDSTDLHAYIQDLITALLNGQRLPKVGSDDWWEASRTAQTASLLLLSAAWLLRNEQERVALKEASVAICQELQRERELVRRRKEEIGQALRRGDADRAYRLTVHHAGWQWAEDIA
jgi:hypothetical protein